MHHIFKQIKNNKKACAMENMGQFWDCWLGGLDLTKYIWKTNIKVGNNNKEIIHTPLTNILKTGTDHKVVIIYKFKKIFYLV